MGKRTFKYKRIEGGPLKIQTATHWNASGCSITCVIAQQYSSAIFTYLHFHLGISCTVFVLTCSVVVLTCFVMWVCVYVWVYVCVGFVMCGCFGNTYTLIYCVLYCLCCVFVLFRLCIFILICFVCTSVRTTATE